MSKPKPNPMVPPPRPRGFRYLSNEDMLQQIKAEATARDRAADRERHRRDMGVGYLVYVARRTANLTQAELAAEINRSPSSVTRWERSQRMPTITDLELVAGAAGLELVIGLRREDDADGEVLVLAVCEDEGLMTELRMLNDPFPADWIEPTRWRRDVEKMMDEMMKRRPSLGRSRGRRRR